MLKMNRYLAGLMCDGNEKDTFDQDTTEHTACKDSSVDPTCSINSQDTDVDINLDSELISKNEVELSKSTLFDKFLMFSSRLIKTLSETSLVKKILIFLRIFHILNL